MPTIKDVSREAGVSVATVSNVINNTRFVSDELKLRVLKAVKRLDYSPDLIAGSLRKRKTNTIGLIIPENNNPFFAELAMEVENIGFLSGYSVIICYTAYNSQKELDYLNVLRSKKVDGLIIVPSKNDPLHINQLASKFIPIVVINRFLKNIKTDMVLLDGYKGMFDMTKYLIGLGHRRIAYIDRPHELPHSIDRLKGYKDALEECRINFDENLFVRTTFGIKGGISAVKELLMKNPLPTAVMAFNDLLAIGSIREFNKRKIKIPEDISLTGFDDIFFSGFTYPSLTTVHFPRKKMAQTAFSLLQERINSKTNSNIKKIILEPRLVIRESTSQVK